MNAKKIDAAKSVKERKNLSIASFFGNVKKELKQVTWTSKEELKTYTKVVLGTTFLFGMIIYFFDIILQSFLQFIGLLGRIIG